MTVSADLLRIAIVREATAGVTPANPVFQLLRVTSESIIDTPQTQLSNELNPARQVTDVIVTGGQSGGDIAFEVSSNPGFEIMLEAALCNLWDGDLLAVGERLFTHTIEKRFTLDAADVDPTRRYDYLRAERSMLDTMTLTFTPGGPGTGAASFIGGNMSYDVADLAGATYLEPGTLPVIVGEGVLPVRFTIEGVEYEGWCLSQLVVTFRNNGRAIACLGQETANEIALGRFECEVTGEIYMNRDTRKVMKAFDDKTEIAFMFMIVDALGNSYAFDFQRVRIAMASQVAGGTNQDVIVSVRLQALVTEVTEGTLTADSCVLIEREHVSPNWPDPEPSATGLKVGTPPSAVVA